MSKSDQHSKTTVALLARRAWNADREMMRRDHPAWPMPAWSRAPMWRRRPYLLDAEREMGKT